MTVGVTLVQPVPGAGGAESSHSAGHTPPVPGVIGGVDTHKDTHHAAVIDHLGRHLGDREFRATRAGYAALLGWLRGFGVVLRVGVEGTGSYGVGLARHLAGERVEVIEVNRPDRSTRRRIGKSDPIDAYAAAEAVLAGRATTTPKNRSGAVEAVRVLRETRAGAVKARTAAINTLKNLITTATDDELRAQLQGLTPARLQAACLALPVDTTRLTEADQATRLALRTHAERIGALDTEITTLDTHLTTVLTATAPTLLAVFGVGTETAGQLLVTAGNNIDRLHSEASLAALIGVSPIPASSGRTDKHRLNRGGDRQGNRAAHQIIVVRLRHHEPTRTYMHKRTTEGLTKKDIMRCLKRHLIREIYRALRTDLTTLTT